MDLLGTDYIFDTKQPDEWVEVNIGLSEGADSTKLQRFCGEDGEVVREAVLGVCRMRMTVSCLEDLIHGGEAWIDFIESSAQDSEQYWDTEYDSKPNTTN